MTNNQKIEILREIINGNLGNVREMCEQFEREELRNDVNSACIKYIKKLISKEFKEFKENVLAGWSRTEMFDRAYEIAVKTEIKDFFENCELDDKNYEILLKIKSETKGTLLGHLYDFYISNEFAVMGNNENIEQWIGWFCELKWRA